MSDYTEHARLSPSGSKKWFACPGSITLEAPIPNKSSTYADDGTAMHEIAARCLTQHYRAVKWVGEQIPVHAAGEEPRFVEFDDEMADLVQGYVDTVRAMAIGYTLLVEQRVDFSEFVGVPGQFGTLDAGIHFHDQGEIFAGDLKTGRTPVHVEGNSQLLLYLLGLLRKLLDDDLGAAETDPFEYARRIGIKTCRIGIYQPKLAAGMREWTCTLEELEAFADVARRKASQVEGAAMMFTKMPRDQWDRTYLNPNPNEEECAFCRAMATCPAAAAKVEREVGGAFSEVVEDAGAAVERVAQSTDDLLGEQMAAAGFIEDWCKAVRAETERRLLAGTPVPGFGLELGRKPPRKWDDVEGVAAAMKEMRMSIEDRFNLKLKSPTQIEALCDPKKNEKPILGPRQWKKLQERIRQGDPSPSVKPESLIKNPYKPAPPSADAFSAVDDASDLA